MNKVIGNSKHLQYIPSLKIISCHLWHQIISFTICRAANVSPSHQREHSLLESSHVQVLSAHTMQRGFSSTCWPQLLLIFYQSQGK